MATLLSVIGFVALGNWQLERAAEKQDRYEMYSLRRQAPVISDSEDLDADPDSIIWRDARLGGSYDGRLHVLLDNRVSNGQAGYHVLTPFILASGRIILVNRGWIPAPDSRATVPDIDMPVVGGPVSGTLAPAPVAGIRLNTEADLVERLSENVIRVQRIDPALIEPYFDDPVNALVLNLDGQEAGGFKRKWPMPGDGSEKHQAYALQWFLFAAVVVVLYVALSLRREPVE